MKKARLFFIVGLLLGFALPAWGHDLFITLRESMTHPPGHYNLVIGYGHAMPMDEFLEADRIKEFAIYDPASTKMDFIFDPKANEGMMHGKAKNKKEYPALTLQAGNYFGQNIQLNKESPRGTYQVALVLKPCFFTMWKNKKGRQKWAIKPLDQVKAEVKDIKEILASVQYQVSAKAVMSVGDWTEPKPLSHDLEIIPLTDLTQIKLGDEVSFKVLYRGKPLKGPMEDPYTIKAYSEFYGASHSYGLYGVVNEEGKATIKITEYGQWFVNIWKIQRVNKEDGPRELVGKCRKTISRATLSFYVKK